MQAKNVIVTSYMYRNKADYAEIVKKYIELGLTSLRVNCTRFSNDDYIWQIEQYRKNYKQAGVNVEIILDIPFPGEKERVFFFNKKKYSVKKGNIYCLKTEEKNIDCEDLLIVKDKKIFRMIKPGDELIIGDGEVQFTAIKSNFNNEVLLMANNTGEFSLGKALTNISNSYTKKCSDSKRKELNDLINKVNPNAIVLSFCERKEQIKEYQDMFPKCTIIPKIESKKGIDNTADMLTQCNEIMLGRGDLGINEQYNCARFQDQVVRLCIKNNKRIIVATGVLDSLANGRIIPTRAEMIDMHHLNSSSNTRIVLAAGCAVNKEVIERTIKYVKML